MRIAFSIDGTDLDAPLGAPFGRCGAFVIVDTHTGKREVAENTARHRSSGAGTGAAALLARRQPDAVVSGMFGSKAARVLGAAGVVMFKSEAGSGRRFVGRAG